MTKFYRLSFFDVILFVHVVVLSLHSFLAFAPALFFFNFSLVYSKVFAPNRYFILILLWVKFYRYTWQLLKTSRSIDDVNCRFDHKFLQSAASAKTFSFFWDQRDLGREKCENKYCTYHPPCRVNVKPKRESRSTDTRMPTMPSPCGVITWPRITDTRLHSSEIINETKTEKEEKQNDLKKSYVSYRKWFDPNKNRFIKINQFV